MEEYLRTYVCMYLDIHIHMYVQNNTCIFEPQVVVHLRDQHTHTHIASHVCDLVWENQLCGCKN